MTILCVYKFTRQNLFQIRDAIILVFSKEYYKVL